MNVITSVVCGEPPSANNGQQQQRIFQVAMATSAPTSTATLLHHHLQQPSQLQSVANAKIASSAPMAMMNGHTNCMFEGGQSVFVNHLRPVPASTTAYLNSESTTTTPTTADFGNGWSAVQPQVSNGSSSGSSSTSGGAVNNTIERANSTQDIAANSDGSLPTSVYWSYPTVLFVPDSYYNWNNNSSNNNNNNNEISCKYWQSQQQQHQHQQPQSQQQSVATLGSYQQAAMEQPPSSAVTTAATSTGNGSGNKPSSPAMTANAASIDGSTATPAGLQYDHEPTFANLTPLRSRVSAAATGDTPTVTVDSQRASDFRPAFDLTNSNPTFSFSSNQLPSNRSYLSQSFAPFYAVDGCVDRPSSGQMAPGIGSSLYNIRKAEAAVSYASPSLSNGGNFSTSSSIGSNNNGLLNHVDATMRQWYGGTLQSSLSAPSLLIGNMARIRSDNHHQSGAMGSPGKSASPHHGHQLQQQLNGSTWSLSSSSRSTTSINRYPSSTTNGVNKTASALMAHHQETSQYNATGSKHRQTVANSSSTTAQQQLQQQQQGSNPNISSTSSGSFNSKKLFICYICSKAYARPSTLRMHMRIHSGVRPYHCRICNKSFCQTANLSAHLRTHNGDKPFSCPMCQRKFSQSSSVKTHMRVHTGQRPYKCQACSKTFSDSSTLAKHRRTHNGDRPYMCSVCYLRFTQSGNLNRHMRIHRSVAPTSSNQQKEMALQKSS